MFKSLVRSLLQDLALSFLAAALNRLRDRLRGVPPAVVEPRDPPAEGDPLAPPDPTCPTSRCPKSDPTSAPLSGESFDARR